MSGASQPSEAAPHDSPDDEVIGEEILLRETRRAGPRDLLERIVSAVGAEAPEAVEQAASWWEGRARQEHAKAQLIAAEARAKLAEARATIDANERENARERARLEREASEFQAAQTRDAAHREIEAQQAETQRLLAQAEVLKAVAALRAAGASVNVDLHDPGFILNMGTGKR